MVIIDTVVMPALSASGKQSGTKCVKCESRDIERVMTCNRNYHYKGEAEMQISTLCIGYPCSTRKKRRPKHNHQRTQKKPKSCLHQFNG